MTRSRLIVLLRFLWKYVCREGVIATGRLLWRRYVYDRHESIVYRGVLAGTPADDRLGDITFKLATTVDVERFGQVDSRRASLFRHLVAGDRGWLFVAYHGDRIVATKLLTRFLPPGGLLARVITLRPDQVFSWETFCLPEYRGRRIAYRLSIFADRHVASLGFTEHLGNITTTNTASLRMNLRKEGVELVYRVSHRRLLFYERLSVEPVSSHSKDAAVARVP